MRAAEDEGRQVPRDEMRSGNRNPESARRAQSVGEARRAQSGATCSVRQRPSELSPDICTGTPPDTRPWASGTRRCNVADEAPRSRGTGGEVGREVRLHFLASADHNCKTIGARSAACFGGSRGPAFCPLICLRHREGSASHDATQSHLIFTHRKCGVRLPRCRSLPSENPLCYSRAATETFTQARR